MKLSIKKFASLALMAAAFLLGPVLNAGASSCSYPTWLKSYLSCYSRTRCSYYSSYYCNSYNYQYNCKNVYGNNNNCGSGSGTGSGGTTNTPPPVVTGSISITPVGTIVGIGTTISIVAPYTAPANSTAQVTLYEDEVPIAVYVIPGTSTSGNAVFSIAVPSYLDVSVFQAQLTYTTTPAPTSGGTSNDCHGRRHKYDDDCGRSVRHYKGGRSCDDDDDDDDDGGTPVTTVLSSEFLIVVKAGGGGGQSG